VPDALCPPDRDLVRLGQQRFHRFEGCFAGVEDANKVVAAVDGMWHQPIQRGKVVGTIARKQ
jgi:hypothetical protein